jgi:hypothetical protein
MTEQQNPPAEETSPPPPCPKCGGDMWDNRVGKRNPKAPDFKCKDRGCDGVIWPPRDAKLATTPAAQGAAPQAAVTGMPLCPICGGPMWDDRLSKRNPKAPDFKCRNKPKMKGGPGCEGVIWPPRAGAPSPYPPPVTRSGERANMSAPPFDDTPPPDGPPPYDDAPRHDDDDLPF